MNTQAWSKGLGWFSVGLGLAELLAAPKIASALGLKSAALVRAYGARELFAGIGLLTQARKGPWIWARVAGDAVDVATLGAAMASRGNPARRNAALAAAVVAPVVAADILCGRELGFS